MPSKSGKQMRMMRGAAHDRKMAKKMGVSQKVAREYARADMKKGRSRPRGR